MGLCCFRFHNHDDINEAKDKRELTSSPRRPALPGGPDVPGDPFGQRYKINKSQ